MIAASVRYRARGGATARACVALALAGGWMCAGLAAQADGGGASQTGPKPAASRPAPANQPVWLQPVAAFPLAAGGTVAGMTIRQHAEALAPFTVSGRCGAFVGQQDGSFEAWTWPLKLVSHVRMAAELKDYPVPIDVNDQAAEIEVSPDHTTITFAHAAFTVREIFFGAPCSGAGDGGTAGGSGAGSGGIVLYQIDSTRPLKLTLSFTPEVKRMWPAANYNAPSPEWVSTSVAPVEGAQKGAGSAESAAAGTGGYYLLHTDSNALAGAVAMPGTAPGILAPYQERPKDWPLQLVLDYQPARDGAKYFPLLMAAGNTAETASKAALTAELAALGGHVAELYQANAHYYAHFFDTRLVAETPDARLNQALRWAEVSIDQLRVRHGDEEGLVAGLYSSGDSNRPGFGWFFGRDALYTLFAVDSYGDFALSREELEFLMRRQREDGKIMHEYSQTAELVDWRSLPYEYAAADATPLFLMAVEDYASASGDTAFVKAHWAEIAKAYTFERTHDSDGDGIYDNSQGTGWVESWPDGMPHQEIYMAALDEQATAAYARLARMAGEAPGEVAEAEARAKAVAATLEREYVPSANGGGEQGAQVAQGATVKQGATGEQGASGERGALGVQGATGGMYAFSRGVDGRLDTTATIYPAVAWFDGHYALPHAEAMFRRWDSHEFSTDWGTRDLGEGEQFYDPLSYHQGSVWPLFTGWASIAEYRTGRSLAGYAHLMQNADLTWASDLGAVTELLSGQYFAPFGRSTTHQLWSSAMVLEPAIRGLFGVSVHGGTILADPHLPADWDGATLRHVQAGGGQVSIVFHREGGSLVVRLVGSGAQLAGPAGSKEKKERAGALSIPLPGAEIAIPAELPLPGASTAQLKVLEQFTAGDAAGWTLEAQGGSTYRLPLRLNGVKGVQVQGAAILPGVGANGLQMLEVHFPPGAGYTRQTVTARW